MPCPALRSVANGSRPPPQPHAERNPAFPLCPGFLAALRMDGDYVSCGTVVRGGWSKVAKGRQHGWRPWEAKEEARPEPGIEPGTSPNVELVIELPKGESYH